MSPLALRPHSVGRSVAVIGERVGVDVDEEGRRAVCGSEIGIGNNITSFLPNRASLTADGDRRHLATQYHAAVSVV